MNINKVMKKVVLVLALLTCLIGANKAQAAKNPGAKMVIVLAVDKELFYFELEREYFEGAVVEIADVDGEVVHSDVLKSKKMVIDFFDVPAGKYVIKVKKGVVTEEFNFEKKEL
jgi:hypothetical protein